MNPPSSTTTTPRKLLQALSEYRARPDRWDEALDPAGKARPPYQRLLDGISAIPDAELKRRQQTSRKLLREHILTYGAVGDTEGGARPWSLDPWPLLLEEREWLRLAKGLAQRGRLLSALVSDFLGPRELVRRGLLPPGLLSANARYLRHGIPATTGGPPLHVIAYDLQRGPDGAWRVVADRTGIPRGLGHVIENRLVLSRSLPDLFEASSVRRIRSFFRWIHSSVLRSSSRGADTRAALLSAGPCDATFFEQAYLAQYLGYPLVEPADLTVRGNQLFLKTLGGLERIDVVLRHLRGAACDPLASTSGVSGVPGFLGALRAGNLAVVNRPGSAVASVAALRSRLPMLARRLLGEDLLLPSTECWWCGDPVQREEAMERLDELVERPAWSTLGPLTDRGEATPDDLRRRIEEHPHDWVLLEPGRGSTAPVVSRDVAHRCVVTLRVFQVAHDSGFRLLPGGLAMLSPLEGDPSSTRIFRDVWVLSSNARTREAEPLVSPIDIRPRRGEELPSRIAESLFWLGRHQQRSESLLRIVRCALGYLTDESAGEAHPEVAALISILRQRKVLGPLDEESDLSESREEQERVLLEALFDEVSPYGFRSNLQRILRLSSNVRERLSRDTWRILGRMEKELTRPPPGDRSRMTEALDVVEDMIVSLAALGGLLTQSMTRSVSWVFMDLGLRIERASNAVSVVQPCADGDIAVDASVLAALLDAADSSMTYRMRYRSTMLLAPVLDLLLRDETNPHSLAFQIDRLREHLDSLRDESVVAYERPEERLALELSTEVRLADIHALGEESIVGPRPRLQELLLHMETGLPRLSDLISHRYLSHVVVTRQSELHPRRPS